jgi:hypothetical protein
VAGDDTDQDDTDQDDSDQGDTDQLVWRIPAYQPALLMLAVVASAALNLYAHPSGTVRIVSLVAGLGCAALAVAGLRLQLVATDDGISVRELLRTHWIEWPQVAGLEVVPNVRGAATVRIHRTDGHPVSVPPSLLQPGKPTSKYLAMRRLEGVARQLEARRQRRRFRPGTAG